MKKVAVMFFDFLLTRTLRNDSRASFRIRGVRGMALTSAWAVGSVSLVTLLDPDATMRQSQTMTAPKGPPPLGAPGVNNRSLASDLRVQKV
jgi:hypothetical protein